MKTLYIYVDASDDAITTNLDKLTGISPEAKEEILVELKKFAQLCKSKATPNQYKGSSNPDRQMSGDPDIAAFIKAIWPLHEGKISTVQFRREFPPLL